MHGLRHEDPTFGARSRSTWEVLRRVIVYLRPYRCLAAGTITCAVLSLLFALAYPKLTQYVIDDVIGRQRADLLLPVILGLIGAFLISDCQTAIGDCAVTVGCGWRVARWWMSACPGPSIWSIAGNAPGPS